MGERNQAEYCPCRTFILGSDDGVQTLTADYYARGPALVYVERGHVYAEVDGERFRLSSHALHAPSYFYKVQA
jgi:hypothetical protein